MFMLIGRQINHHSDYDSYTRQALLWLEGKTSLNEDIAWLELAVYQGKYYISFPPVPSLFILPLAALYGLQTPNTLLTAIYGMLSFCLVFCYTRYIRHRTYSEALFWAGFIVFGCNILYLSLEGAAWYQAQVLCFLMSVCSICALSAKKPALNYAGVLFWALSVGCRPFNAVFLPVIVLLLARSHGIDRLNPVLGLAKRLWKYFIPAAVVFALLLYYNWVRFGDLFEFGHNYLPGMVSFPDGQFSLKYVWPNLRKSFHFPELVNGRLQFKASDCNFLLLVNPVYILWISVFFKRDLKPETWMVAGLVLVNALALYMHNTLGVMQFGFRYFVDMIPWIAFAMLDSDVKLTKPVLLLAAYSVLINIYGALWFHLKLYKI